MNYRTGGGIAAVLAISCILAPTAALAQKSGGILRTYNSSNPPSASIIEEATIATAFAFAPVFNNLVIFDQQEPINKPNTIRPELAESWAWDQTNTKLTMKLRQDAKWHDGKPFTAQDVKCTWERILGKDKDAFRKNPRKLWWTTIKEIVPNGDHEVTFELSRPHAAFLSLLASNLSPVYPCHVTTAAMRTKPIGTGPFKFVAFEANNVIRLEKNPDYWRPGRPYLDGVEIRIIGNHSTRILAFGANEFDITFVADVTGPLIGDVMSRSPQAQCKLVPTGVSTNLLVNRTKPPFDDPKLREAMTLALDRDAMVKIVTAGKASISGAMMGEPEGNWPMPTAKLMQFAAYAGTMDERRAKARKIMTEPWLWTEQEAQGQGRHARLPVVQESGRAARRSAQPDLFRGRARDHRIDALLWPGRARRLCRGAQPDRLRRRRSGRDLGRGLQLRFRAQLHQILQQGRRRR